jgi:glycine oxidase
MPKPIANPSSPNSPPPLAHNRHASGTVGIVGAGLMGRLLAFRLSEQGWKVTLFDRDSTQGEKSCGHTGAGMLSPLAELESSEPIIAQLGFESIALWEKLLGRLSQSVFFQRAGTVIVAHHLDAPELGHFARMLQSKLARPGLQKAIGNAAIRWQLSQSELQTLEPQLSKQFSTGIYLPQEGQIDNRQLMPALAQALQAQGVTWQANQEVVAVLPHHVDSGEDVSQFDWVIDCRGLGARPNWEQVRGVRGEIIRVHAPEVSLHRPVRLMHPRHPLYVAPRENQHYLIGATSLESEDFRPMTLQSAMELLSAAFTVHSGFAEASILEMAVNCRPALPDNLPRITVEAGLIQVNGLYRHGFLISPKLAELVCGLMATGGLTDGDVQYQGLLEIEEEAPNYATAH